MDAGTRQGQLLADGTLAAPTSTNLVYSDLYRFSFLAVAVLVSLMAVYVMHHVLNRFASTRLVE